ncbi:collagen-like protein [Leptobacterium flavescens]|uniref:Collagen-like protein n=1 Tax=Leptobacterium flavescens TaxID=472055 RepID=A0A6P0UNJ5_9FLAO|nr:collagen-like protein [Leptobacterium flavescens]NER14072.1 collagen-like protein [Leptobacterium flavescens]
MYKLLRLIFPISLALFFVSCEGDPGPPGIDGADGIDGVNILGQVVEIQGDFTQGNNFTLDFTFPSSIEVFESDAVLVFLLEETVDDGNGGTLDVWTPLPQNFFLNEGLLQYTFNHTFVDVSIFLDGDFDLTLTPDTFTQDQVFRIVVVPGEFAQNATIDLGNFNTVMKTLNLSSKDIKKLPL